VAVGGVAVGDDVGVAGVVDVANAAGVVGAAAAGTELDFDFGFGVGVMRFGIVVDGIEVTEEVSEETVDIENGVVVIEHVGTEVLDIVVAVAEVEVVDIDAFERYTVDVDIGEEVEDYVGAALEKRS
jgi:hypothetical protein